MTRTFTLLVADDEALIRRIFRRQLERRLKAHDIELRLLEAADGGEAIKLVVDHPDEIGLIISDIGMPRMRGDAFYRAVCDQIGDTPFWFMSGHDQRFAPEGVRLIEKPFGEELFDEIARLAVSIVDRRNPTVALIEEDLPGPTPIPMPRPAPRVFVIDADGEKLSASVAAVRELWSESVMVEALLVTDETPLQKAVATVRDFNASLVILDLRMRFADNGNTNAGAELARALRNEDARLFLLLSSDVLSTSIILQWTIEFGGTHSDVCSPAELSETLRKVKDHL